MIRLKRVYDPVEPSDAERILAERWWPGGLTRPQARIDRWMPDLAPNREPRQWYGHDPAKWTEFQKRYGLELDANGSAVDRSGPGCKAKGSRSSRPHAIENTIAPWR